MGFAATLTSMLHLCLHTLFGFALSKVADKHKARLGGDAMFIQVEGADAATQQESHLPNGTAEIVR